MRKLRGVFLAGYYSCLASLFTQVLLRQYLLQPLKASAIGLKNGKRLQGTASALLSGT